MSNLDSDCEYLVRVVPIRLLGSSEHGEELAGPASPVLVVNTLGEHQDAVDSASTSAASSRTQADANATPVRERKSGTSYGRNYTAGDRRPLSDQQKAGIIIFALFIFAIVAAFVTEAYINWHKTT